MPDVFAVLAAAERAIAQAVLESYRTWLAAVRGSVLAPFNRFRLAPDPNGVWAASPLWDSRVERFLRDLREVARHGWQDAADGLGEPLPFDHQSSILTDQLQRTRNLMVRTPDEVYRRVIAELAKGGSIDQQADRVRQLLDVTGTENWTSRAKTVAATETWRAYAFGGLAAAQRLSLRVGAITKRWDSMRDTAVRNGHRRAHGQTRPLNQPFEVSGEAMMAPLDPSGSPSNVINCVTGDTPVAGSFFETGFKYFHDGPMLSIVRESGSITSVSPNHPVITERGWIEACKVNKGEHLLCARELLPAVPGVPDVEAEPALAAQIYDALTESGIAQRVGDVSIDFYGDRPRGDVDVVFVDRQLSFGINPELEKILEEFLFACSNFPTASGSALSGFLKSDHTSPGGIMGLDNLVCSLRGGHETPLKLLGFALGSDLDTKLTEDPSKLGSGDPVSGGKLLEAGGLIFLDKVVEVRKFDFSGHLYTFGTRSNAYLADGIVSHNCRCIATYSRRR